MRYQPGDWIVTNDRHGRNRLLKALMAFTIEDLEAAGCVGETKFGVRLINLDKLISKGFFAEDVACKTLFVA